MARVRRQRTASISSAAVRHKQDSRKKAPYRVILEEVTQKKKLQTYVSLKLDPKSAWQGSLE